MNLKVRVAEPSDREPLMSFIKGVWGGHDYIPRVWDEWIEDPSATMFVGEADRRAVAMIRVRLLEDGSAWLEGVRVHPDFRRMGVASTLGRTAMEFAEKSGASVFRLTSGSRNRGSHAQVATLGFQEVSRFSLYEPKKGIRFRVHPEVRVSNGRECKLIGQSMRASPEYRLGGGVVWDGFTATTLVPGVVKGRLAGGAIYHFQGAVAIRVIQKEGIDVWNQIGYISGDRGPAMTLVDHIFAIKGKFDWRFVVVPQKSDLIHALRERGFTRAFSNVLFEKKVANG